MGSKNGSDILSLPFRSPNLLRAGNGTRTRDPNLGKVVLYQLSYSRVQAKYRDMGKEKR